MNIIYQSSNIRVAEFLDADGDMQRQLFFGPDFLSCQGALKTSRPLYQLHEFTRHLTYAAFTPAVPLVRILFLGLGAGIAIHATEKFFPSAHVDIVDYNRELFEISHKYFFDLEQPGFSLISDDAATFILQSTSTYDLICCDIWGPSLETPTFLRNADFYDAVRARLREGGSFAINISANEHKRVSEMLAHRFLSTISLRGNNAFFISSDQPRIEPHMAPPKDTLATYNIDVEAITNASISIRSREPSSFD